MLPDAVVGSSGEPWSHADPFSNPGGQKAMVLTMNGSAIRGERVGSTGRFAPARPPADRTPVAPFSRRTERAYVLWTRRFVDFRRLRHQAGMRELEVNAFLTHLAVERKVNASTRNQAPSALLFLCPWI